jgi:hypothetical protein
MITIRHYILLCAAGLTGASFVQPATAQSGSQIQAIEQQIKASLAARDRDLKAAQQQARDAQEQAAAASAAGRAGCRDTASLPGHAAGAPAAVAAASPLTAIDGRSPDTLSRVRRWQTDSR